MLEYTDKPHTGEKRIKGGARLQRANANEKVDREISVVAADQLLCACMRTDTEYLFADDGNAGC